MASTGRRMFIRSNRSLIFRVKWIVASASYKPCTWFLYNDRPRATYLLKICVTQKQSHSINFSELLQPYNSYRWQSELVKIKHLKILPNICCYTHYLSLHRHVVITPLSAWFSTHIWHRCFFGNNSLLWIIDVFSVTCAAKLTYIFWKLLGSICFSFNFVTFQKQTIMIQFDCAWWCLNTQLTHITHEQLSEWCGK